MMEKLYCVIYGKYRKFEEPKIPLKKKHKFFILLVLSIICSKCKNKDEQLFKEEKSVEILKILCLFENI